MLEGQLNREFLKFGNYPLSLSLSFSMAKRAPFVTT